MARASLGYNGSIWLALLAGLLVRLALVGIFATAAHRSFDEVVRGHDGGEYVDFARALFAGGVAAVPAEARRHEPGWPLAIAPIASLPHAESIAWFLAYAALCGSVVMGARLLNETGLANQPEQVRWAWAMVLLYPAQVYYGCFALSESMFTLMMLAGFYSYARAGRIERTETRPSPSEDKSQHLRVLAFFFAGLAGLVRGPGMLLGLVFTIDTVWNGAANAQPNNSILRRLLRCWPLVFSITPWVVWTLLARRTWGGDLIVHQPRFGFPFSGFADWRQFGAGRAAYIFLCVLAVLVSTGALFAQWRRSPVWRTMAVFAGLFTMFHLCLRSLHYVDRDVLTFNYQDRYFVGILPILLLPWLKCLRWWMVLGAAVVSVTLSAYWGIHYFQAAAGR